MIRANRYRAALRDFKRMFGLNLNEFIDPLLTSDCELGFDYIKFAQVLESRHKDDLQKGDMSLQEVVTKHYGAKAAECIKELL